MLVTSGTVSSARVLSARLPAGAFHQYAPIDAPKFVERFLDHWRPDIAVFAESELWPNIVTAVRARGAPLVLANARISRKSAERWRAVPGAAKSVFGAVDLCLAQDFDNAARFLALGARCVRIAGNLKFDVPPPPADFAILAEFNGAIGARPAWAAVSTHPGEEDLVLDAHVDMAAQTPSLLTIIAPRRGERGVEIVKAARARGLTAALRSQEANRDVTSTFISSTASASLASFFEASGSF